jgi:hypothetical protein
MHVTSENCGYHSNINNYYCLSLGRVGWSLNGCRPRLKHRERWGRRHHRRGGGDPPPLLRIRVRVPTITGRRRPPPPLHRRSLARGGNHQGGERIDATRRRRRGRCRGRRCGVGGRRRRGDDRGGSQRLGHLGGIVAREDPTLQLLVVVGLHFLADVRDFRLRFRVATEKFREPSRAPYDDRM